MNKSETHTAVYRWEDKFYRLPDSLTRQIHEIYRKSFLHHRVISITRGMIEYSTGSIKTIRPFGRRRAAGLIALTAIQLIFNIFLQKETEIKNVDVNND